MVPRSCWPGTGTLAPPGVGRSLAGVGWRAPGSKGQGLCPVSFSDQWCLCFLQSRKTLDLRWPPLPVKTEPLVRTLSQTLSRSQKGRAPPTSQTPGPVCPHPATSLCPTPPSQVSTSGSLSPEPAGPPALGELRWEGKSWVRASCHLVTLSKLLPSEPPLRARQAKQQGT